MIVYRKGKILQNIRKLETKIKQGILSSFKFLWPVRTAFFIFSFEIFKIKIILSFEF